MAKFSVKKQNDNGANLGFEAQLWATADKLRGNMEPSDYKHVALGLIFPEVHLGRLRGEACRAAPREAGRRGGPGGVPRRKRILGAEEGPLVASPGQGEAANDR